MHEQQCFIRDIKIRGEAEYLRSDKTHTANVLNYFKNDRSSKFIGEVIVKKYVIKKYVIYVNQGKSRLSQIKIRPLMIFLCVFLMNY